MITEVLNFIRTMPGPLKKPRVIFADLAEEILDIAKTYYRESIEEPTVPTDSAEKTPASEPAPKTEADLDNAPTVKIKAAPKKHKAPSKPAAPNPAAEDAVISQLAPMPELVPLLNDPKVMRKQDFKVLAILWDAAQRDAGLLSAKEAADYGELIGIQIRHENIRKVIRLRLSKEVETHKARGSSGNATIFRYRLAPNGIEHFESTYIKPAE